MAFTVTIHGWIGNVRFPAFRLGFGTTGSCLKAVTGFGCRPFTDFETGATGPAFESRQGRKARVWGTRISGRYGDFGWRHRCSGHSVRCAALPRMMLAAGARARRHGCVDVAGLRSVFALLLIDTRADRDRCWA